MKWLMRLFHRSCEWVSLSTKPCPELMNSNPNINSLVWTVSSTFTKSNPNINNQTLKVPALKHWCFLHLQVRKRLKLREDELRETSTKREKGKFPDLGGISQACFRCQALYKNSLYPFKLNGRLISHFQMRKALERLTSNTQGQRTTNARE